MFVYTLHVTNNHHNYDSYLGEDGAPRLWEVGKGALRDLQPPHRAHREVLHLAEVGLFPGDELNILYYDIYPPLSFHIWSSFMLTLFTVHF